MPYEVIDLNHITYPDSPFKEDNNYGNKVLEDILKSDTDADQKGGRTGEQQGNIESKALKSEDDGQHIEEVLYEFYHGELPAFVEVVLLSPPLDEVLQAAADEFDEEEDKDEDQELERGDDVSAYLKKPIIKDIAQPAHVI